MRNCENAGRRGTKVAQLDGVLASAIRASIAIPRHGLIRMPGKAGGRAVNLAATLTTGAGRYGRGVPGTAIQTTRRLK